VPTVPSSPTAAPARLRHRRNARALTAGQLANFRKAITASQAIKDDRGYQAWAGIHGLPLPISCVHGDELFLPWHRAYLYLFEKALQDRVPGVTLPWWDWTNHVEGIPGPYARKNVEGKKNPLYDSPIQASGRARPNQTRTSREPGDADELPSAAEIELLLKEKDYLTFQNKLEGLHGGVHMWTGGTMGSVPTAAYDPVFWAHHCMIDRLWYLWQLRHAGASVPASQLDRALAPFPMTVRQTLDVTQLGYDYAASTAAAQGPGRG
jgi:tyrosinase